MWRRPANLAPVPFPLAALPTSNKVTAHFSFFIGLKGPYRFGHQTLWYINSQVHLPLSLHTHTSPSYLSFICGVSLFPNIWAHFVANLRHNSCRSLAFCLCRLFNYIRKRTKALTTIVCYDSDPLKAITRQRVETKITYNYANNILELFLSWHCRPSVLIKHLISRAE